MSRVLALPMALVLLGVAVPAHAERVRLHAEVDPLPFVRGGYGGQVGARFDPVGRWRIAAASFSLDVPDFAVQIGDGNDGFHARVRPSVALYVLYYLSPGHDGWAFGGAVRYLRLRYTHDDSPAERADVAQLSPELIAAYKWHPTRAGFYLQPWFGLSATIVSSGEITVGARTYDALPLQPFFTVNLGWELALP